MDDQTAHYRLDDLIIDTGARQVTRAGADLGISGLSFDLLLAVGEAAPALVSTDAIMARVWPGRVVGNEALTQRVKLLRRLLGDDASAPRYIAGKRGYGYRALSRMQPLGSGTPVHSRAHELYLQARVTMRGTPESRARAYSLLAEALALDPDFAPALAYRALLQAGSVPLSGAGPDVLACAQADAEAALRLDPGLADACVALAFIAANSHRWVDAAVHFERALALEPGNGFIRNLHTLIVLRPTGRLGEARRELDTSWRRDPTDGFTAHELALTSSLQGDDDAALRFAHVGVGLAGASEPAGDILFVYARAAARRGEFAAAAQYAAGALPEALARHEHASAALDLAYRALADPAQLPRARKALTAFIPQLRAAAPDGRTTSFFAVIGAQLGDLALAFELFAPQVNFDPSDLWLPEMGVLRADARFQRLVDALDMREYWQRFGPADAYA